MDEPAINRYSVRVRAHQTDVNGAMYHGAYFDIFDDARIETFRRLGYDYKRMSETTYRPVIRRIECEFYAPAFMDELLAVTVSVPRVSAATISIRYECRRGDVLLALANVVFAFVDRTGRPGRMPADLRAVVQAHPELQPLT